jgi:hypothetical protein
MRLFFMEPLIMSRHMCIDLHIVTFDFFFRQQALGKWCQAEGHILIGKIKRKKSNLTNFHKFHPDTYRKDISKALKF